MGYKFLAILAIAAAIFLFTLVLKIFKKPIKLVFKLLINALSGFVTLWLINLIGGIFDFQVIVNWPAAILTGILGLPGVVIIILFQHLFS